MFIDLKKEILAALASEEGRQILREALASMAPANEPAPDDQLLTASEAAALLGMTERAVRQAAYRGSLPSVQVGRRLRFRRSELLSRAA